MIPGIAPTTDFIFQVVDAGGGTWSVMDTRTKGIVFGPTTLSAAQADCLTRNDALG